jgi:hypothetical protein
MATTLRRTGGIQEVDVWNAADALLLAGERPTIERVRQKLGRGSPNTVSPYLDAWFASLGARIKDPGAFSAPNQVPDPIAQAAQHFWQSALAVARAESDSRVRSREAELEVAVARVTEQAKVLAARENDLQEAAREANTRAMQAVERAERLQVDLVKREESNAQATADLATYRATAESLERELGFERQSFGTERQSMEARHLAYERSMALEVDRAREATKQVQAKLTQLEKNYADRSEHSFAEIATLNQEIFGVRQSADHWQRQVEIRQASEKALRAELSDLQSAAATREKGLTLQIVQLQTQLGAAIEQLRAKDEQHGVLLKSLVASSSSQSVKLGTRRRSSGTDTR